MQTRIHVPKKKVSDAFAEIATSFTAETISIGALLELIGQQGMLAMCILASVPFLLPISIPGTSTPFGLLIILVGIGITAGRIPWLPGALLRREISASRMKQVLQSGAKLFRRVERLVHPRAAYLVEGPVVSRLNGIALVAAGFLLMLPLPIPGTNTPPAWASLLLAAGILERDGWFVAAGYGVLLITAALFGGLAVAVFFFGAELNQLLGAWLGT